MDDYWQNTTGTHPSSSSIYDEDYEEFMGKVLHDFHGDSLGTITSIVRIGELEDVLSIDLIKESIPRTILVLYNEISKVGDFVLLNTDAQD